MEMISDIFFVLHKHNVSYHWKQEIILIDFVLDKPLLRKSSPVYYVLDKPVIWEGREQEQITAFCGWCRCGLSHPATEQMGQVWDHDGVPPAHGQGTGQCVLQLF